MDVARILGQDLFYVYWPSESWWWNGFSLQFVNRFLVLYLLNFLQMDLQHWNFGWMQNSNRLDEFRRWLLLAVLSRVSVEVRGFRARFFREPFFAKLKVLRSSHHIFGFLTLTLSQFTLWASLLQPRLNDRLLAFSNWCRRFHLMAVAFHPRE